MTDCPTPAPVCPRLAAPACAIHAHPATPAGQSII